MIKNLFFNRLFVLVFIAVLLINIPLTLSVGSKYHDNVRQEAYDRISDLIYLVISQHDRGSPLAADTVNTLLTPQLNVSLTALPKHAYQIHSEAYDFSRSYAENSVDIKQQLEKLPYTKNSSSLIGSYYITETKQWLNFEFHNDNPYPILAVVLSVTELFIIFVGLSYVLSVQRFIKPWQKVQSLSKRLGISSEYEKLPMFFGPRLIRQSVDLMQKMAARIDELIAERISTIASLSHDIRTPLTRAELYVQKLSEDKIKTELAGQLEEINYLTTETLNYAKQDFRAEQKMRFDLVSLLQTLCHNRQDANQAVTLDCNVNYLPINAQRIGLKRTFDNLINNALKYGQSAAISVEKLDDNNVYIGIADQGPGLDEADLSKVFTPFYRAENSRSRQTGGTGLGLTIVKSIIDNNAGRILLTNREQGGLLVKVFLPLEKLG